MSAKVFCKDCKHYRESMLMFSYLEYPTHGCVATTRLDPVSGEKEDRVDCRKRNAGMNCGLFELREPEPEETEPPEPRRIDKPLPEALGRYWRTKAVLLLFLSLVVMLAGIPVIFYVAERAGVPFAPLLPLPVGLIWLFVAAVRGDVKEARKQ